MAQLKNEKRLSFNTRLLICLFLFLQASARLFGQHKVADFTELEHVVLKELKDTNTPGAAIAVVSGDRVIFSKGFGVSNVETGSPVTPDMAFRIGSITKMFTAAMLVTLTEERRMSLEEPIGNYVKGLNTTLSQVTAHQLLSHTAGMTDESPADYGSHDDAALAFYVRSLKDDHFFTEPGKIFSYSNPGYDVAGLITEEIGGKAYADQMSERLFKPLGMNSTTFRPTVAMTYPLSQGHVSSVNAKPTVIRPFVDNVAGWPDGFIFSSVNDLARFAIAFMNGGQIDGKKILMSSAITRLSTPYADIHSPFGFENGKYGYGLFIHNYRGMQMVWHAGLISGFGALFQMVPAQRFAVIILANRSEALLNRTAEKALELILPLEKKTKSNSKQTLAISQTEIINYIGTYSNKPEQVQILVRDGRLFLKRADGEFLVSKVGNYRFSINKQSDSTIEEFVLVPDDNGQILYLHMGRHALKKMSTK
jgi:CubicO group peptidase (beta-lactamase class C family)